MSGMTPNQRRSVIVRWIGIWAVGVVVASLFPPRTATLYEGGSSVSMGPNWGLLFVTNDAFVEATAEARPRWEEFFSVRKGLGWRLSIDWSFLLLEYIALTVGCGAAIAIVAIVRE